MKKTRVTFSDKSIGFYSTLLSSKVNWIPIEPKTKQEVSDDVVEVLQKALSLSKLELPVGDWIQDESNLHKDLHPVVSKLLVSNIQDEVRHDIALNNIRAVFNVPQEYDTVVDQFLDRANHLANLYSPVTMAGVLESSVFFVILPMFRFLGSAAMRTTANDISNDEQKHVSTNLQLIEDLGYYKGHSLNVFRGEVIDWLTSSMESRKFDYVDKYKNRNFWIKSSESLYSKGQAKGLSATQNSVMPCFFEGSNDQLPIYG